MGNGEWEQCHCAGPHIQRQRLIKHPDLGYFPTYTRGGSIYEKVLCCTVRKGKRGQNLEVARTRLEVRSFWRQAVSEIRIITHLGSVGEVCGVVDGDRLIRSNIEVDNSHQSDSTGTRIHK